MPGVHNFRHDVRTSNHEGHYLKVRPFVIGRQGRMGIGGTLDLRSPPMVIAHTLTGIGIIKRPATVISQHEHIAVGAVGIMR